MVAAGRDEHGLGRDKIEPRRAESREAHPLAGRARIEPINHHSCHG
jgi:hypothetical protein